MDICPDFNNLVDPWDNKYSFTALTANFSSGVQPAGSGERSEHKLTSIDKAWIQSPFQEVLNVFLPYSDSDYDKINLQLLNVNGKIIMEESFDFPTTHVALDVGTFPAGIYILRIQSKGKVQSLKTLKLG